MKIKEFSHLLGKMDDLTLHQIDDVAKKIAAIKGSREVNAVIESRVEHSRTCPHCGHDHIVKHGSSNGLQRYRCGQCRKTFNALSGTPMARLRRKSRWIDYASHMIDGRSVRESAARCGVHRNTAFRWRHRFLSLVAQRKAQTLSGIAEVDETYFLQSLKGSRHLKAESNNPHRKPRKRGGKALKPGLSKEQICVLVARDRAGNTTDGVFADFNAEAFGDFVVPVLQDDTVLCTDGLSVYKSFAAMVGIQHKSVRNKTGRRVIGQAFHIQNVNAYHSRLKDWMRRFHGVATKYLHHYLGWRRALEQHHAETPKKWLRGVLDIQNNPQLTVT